MDDWDGLENRCTLTGTEGSNPSLSATEKGLCQIAAKSFSYNGGDIFGIPASLHPMDSNAQAVTPVNPMMMHASVAHQVSSERTASLISFISTSLFTIAYIVSPAEL